MKFLITIGIAKYIPFLFVRLVEDTSLISRRDPYKSSIMQLLEYRYLLYL